MQTNGRPSKVLLKSPNSRLEERRAGGTIKPGHLIDITATNTVVVHAGAAGAGVGMRIATEEDLMLRGGTINGSYLVTELVSYRNFQKGDEIQVWLEDGHNIAIGDKLESAGNGEFQALTTGQALLQALEAVDTSGAEPASMIRVEVL